MIDEDAAERDGRARRRTWVTGGVLLVLSASVGFVARFELAGLHYAMDVLWAAAVLTLVVGLGRAGSITGRRPFVTAVVMLQLAVANPLTASWMSGLAPDDLGSPYVEEDAYMGVMLPYFGAVGVLTVAAVLLVGIVGALPRPWSWAPAAVLALSAVSAAASVVLFSSDVAAVARRILFEVPGVGIVFLGVLAIVLGVRATAVSEPVLSSEAPTP